MFNISGFLCVCVCVCVCVSVSHLFIPDVFATALVRSLSDGFEPACAIISLCLCMLNNVLRLCLPETLDNTQLYMDKCESLDMFNDAHHCKKHFCFEI